MEHVDLISIDPGVHQVWVCGWSPNWKLIRAKRLKVDSGCQVAEYLSQYKGAVLAIEFPVIRKGGRFGQARPDDILRLASAVGWCEAAPWLEIARYKPAEWKGNVPKDIHNARVLRQLSHSERAVIDSAKIPRSLLPNIYDACGVGLHHLRTKGFRS